MSCTICGNVCWYADDTAYSCSSHFQRSSQPSTSCSEFLVYNRLKLNHEQNHIMVLTTSQAKVKAVPNLNFVISTPDSDIRTTPTENLLDAWLQQHLKWAEHLQNHKENLLKVLSTSLSAITKLAQVASCRTMQMIANDIFMSKLSYLS